MKGEESGRKLEWKDLARVMVDAVEEVWEGAEDSGEPVDDRERGGDCGED